MFAESNLKSYFEVENETEQIKELSSCVSYLKQALDCQVECFLFSFGISKRIKKRNLSLEKKLEFISCIGVFSSRSISRFINLRNKLQHEFKKPVVEDIETLFDLVVACVSLLKMHMTQLSTISYSFEILDNEGALIGNLYFRYFKDPLSIIIHYRWHQPVRENSLQRMHMTEEEAIEKYGLVKKVDIEAEFSDLESFTYLLRCLLTLSNLDVFGSWDHVREKLELSE